MPRHCLVSRVTGCVAQTWLPVSLLGFPLVTVLHHAPSGSLRAERPTPHPPRVAAWEGWKGHSTRPQWLEGTSMALVLGFWVEGPQA